MNLPNICIVGSGVYLGKHFTLETVEVLKRCKHVYTIIREDRSEWVPEGIDAEISDLFHLYEIGANRTDNYNRVIDFLLDAASPDSSIAYLTYGNPVVFDSVTHGLLAKGSEKNLDVHVYPTVSSIDTILVDLGREMAPGLQIFEASFFVCCEIEPRTDLPCILLQLGVFGTSFATYDQPNYGKLNLLADYLKKFYPDEHPLFLVNSQTSIHAPPTVFEVSISDLNNLNEEQKMCQSLYIPNLREAKPNEEFMTLMNQAPVKA